MITEPEGHLQSCGKRGNLDSDCPGCDVAEPCFCPSLCLWPWVSHLGIRGHLYEARMWCQALFRVSLCVTSSTPYGLPRSWMASSPCFTFITPPGGSASPSVRREVPPSHSLWGLNKKVDLQRKYVPLPQIGGGGRFPLLSSVFTLLIPWKTPSIQSRWL